MSLLSLKGGAKKHIIKNILPQTKTSEAGLMLFPV